MSYATDWLDFAKLEEKIFGSPARWCRDCQTWHVRACSPDTRRPWWERIDVEMSVNGGLWSSDRP